MNSRFAERLVKESLVLSDELDATAWHFRELCGTGEDFAQYRQLVGKLMGWMYADFIYPLTPEFPDLKELAIGKREVPVGLYKSLQSTSQLEDQISNLIDRVEAWLQKIQIDAANADLSQNQLHWFKDGVEELENAIAESRAFLDGWKNATNRAG